MKQISDSTLVPLVQCEFVVHYVGKTTPRCRVLPLVHPSRTLVHPPRAPWCVLVVITSLVHLVFTCVSPP